MPRLNERKPSRVPTFLSLPQTTRDDLESAIGTPGIDNLTDAVTEAARLLARHVRRKQSKNAPMEK